MQRLLQCCHFPRNFIWHRPTNLYVYQTLTEDTTTVCGWRRLIYSYWRVLSPDHAWLSAGQDSTHYWQLSWVELSPVWRCDQGLSYKPETAIFRFCVSLKVRLDRLSVCLSSVENKQIRVSPPPRYAALPPCDNVLVLLLFLKFFGTSLEKSTRHFKTEKKTSDVLWRCLYR